MKPALLPRLADATGGRVVCLATGPSLTQADVDYCRGKAAVIAVNDAHRMAPWADVLYSSDRFWWVHHHGVKSFGGIRATIEQRSGKQEPALVRLHPQLVFFRHTGLDGVEVKPDGIRTCGDNSGGAALNVALHLGAKTIILLGYDMGYTNGQRHFFGSHPQGLSNNHNFPGWRKRFDTMRPEFDRLGVKVVNCTQKTSLDAFPCVRLEDAL